MARPVTALMRCGIAVATDAGQNGPVRQSRYSCRHVLACNTQCPPNSEKEGFLRISLSPGWGSSGIAQFAPHRAHGEAAHGHFDDARSVRRVLDGELLDRAAVEFDQGRAGDGGIEDEAFG